MLVDRFGSWSCKNTAARSGAVVVLGITSHSTLADGIGNREPR
jgi:hypothetical protein